MSRKRFGLWVISIAIYLCGCFTTYYSGREFKSLDGFYSLDDKRRVLIASTASWLGYLAIQMAKYDYDHQDDYKKQADW